ncbi:MAG: lamin tail domain-containing protein [Candidatus Uhrbacteria bacterium]|nr:lamin tail domain-containing protein [Candidatus Uhrbacteria bacterium]
MKKLYAIGTLAVLSFMLALPASAEDSPAPAGDTAAENSQESTQVEEPVVQIDETTATDVPTIYISEINWAGSSGSTADEWIELFNPNGQSVDIGGWILTGSATSRSAISLEVGTVIPAKSTLLIANYGLGHANTTLGVTPELVTASISIINTDIEIMLATPEGIVVDEVAFPGTPEFGSTNPIASMERNLTTLEWFTSSTNTNLLDASQLGTPGALIGNAPEVIYEVITEGGETTGELEGLEELTDETSETLETSETPASYDSGTLLLSQIVSDPENGTEIVKIFNPGLLSINLTDWTVRDATLRATKLENLDLTTGEYYTIENPSGQLNNGGDLIQLLDPAGNIIDYVQYGTDEIPAPGKGEALSFEEGAWQIVSYAPATTNEEITEELEELVTASEEDTEELEGLEELANESYETSQISDETSETPETSGTSDTSETSETYETHATSETLTSYNTGDLVLSEIVSDPEDGIEWIEIMNPGSTLVTLEGWTVRDATERETKIENFDLDGGEYFVIENPSGKLNNGGDTVELVDPSGNIIDSMKYGTAEIAAPKKGESLALQNGEWHIALTTTKGSTNSEQTENIISESYENEQLSEDSDKNSGTAVSDDSNTKTIESPSVSSSKSNSTAKNANVSNEPTTHSVIAVATSTATKAKTTTKTPTSRKADAKTTMTGTITATPGTFGNQIAFMDGIELYFYYADWPELEVGDIVSVVGTLSESRGEERIKLSAQSDITVTGHQEINPRDSTIDELANALEGELVTIHGNVLERDGTKLTVKDDSGQVAVIAYDGTGISWYEITSNEVRITGVVRHIDGSPRVYPRSSADIQQIAQTAVAEESAVIASVSKSRNLTPWFGAGLFTAASGALFYWFVRGKQMKLVAATA